MFKNKINKAFEPFNWKKSLKEMVPLKYDEFLPLFEKPEANTLPLQWLYVYQILQKERFPQPYGSIYVLSQPELEELR